ncbi:MAG TPA: anti-sigma factor [Gammaproteobacteria bacterium]|nr:anti-sigma factor [Gammaproteobacteria bacterium]
MNYDSPELRELLAGEYALGTLTGAARRRFDRLLIEDAHLRTALADWEASFAVWAAGIPRQAPPARVWRRIARETGGRSPRQPFWRSLALWQTCTAMAAAALIAIVAWWQISPAPTPAPAEMAVITSEAGQPVWVVSVRPHSLTIKAPRNAAPPAGKAYELWMLPGNGAKPVSLGLLPATGEVRRRLTVAQAQALASAQAVAVSIEPPGGSPTGQPTGPVVYSAPLVET